MIFGRNIKRYYLKYFPLFAIGIIALVVVDIYQLDIPNIIGDIIDGLKSGVLTKVSLEEYIKQILTIVLIMFAGRFLWRLGIFGSAILIEANLRDRMFRHSEKLSQRYFHENKTGALMALYTNDLQTIRASFGQGTVMFIDAVFLGVLAFIRMWNLDVTLTIISAVPLLVLALCGRIIGKYMTKKYSLRQKAFANLSDFTQESFSGISVIKAFVKEGKELLAFSKINQDNMEKNLDFIKAAVLLQVMIGTLIGSIIVIIIGYGGYLIYKDSGTVFTIGQLTKFISFFGILTWPMMALSHFINLRSQASASLKRINTLLNEKIEIQDHKNVIYNHDFKGNITINNLSFTYPSGSNPALSNISFTIKEGESLGIIGRTGSGKTTLVDLLLRIYNIERDQIYFDDIDIMDLPFKDIRNIIAYVPQDNFLFSDTIENNINFSLKTLDSKKVEEASVLADLDENIKEFKEGYQTVLGERGVTISGGQKQRTSIARALIKDAKILILDDSVSAVDTKTEEKILQNLKKIRKGKTTILIAHRISTIQTLDKIALIDEGKLIGFGTHQELLKTCSLYEKMVKLQKLEDEVEGSIDE